MIEPVTQPQLQAQLGVEPDEDGLPRWSGVTTLLRQALSRWGLTRAASLCRHVQSTLAACGYEGHSDRVHDALELLCLLGDAELVWADAPPPPPTRERLAPGETEESIEAPRLLTVSGRLVAPTLPRAVRMGERHLVVGSREVDRIPYERWGPSGGERAAVRWVRANAEEELEASGFELVPAERWLGPPSVLDHLERRGAGGQTLDALWPSLLRALEAGGGPIEDPRRVMILGGEPGTFWGRPGSAEGRWRTVDRADDGTSLGVILGHHGGRTQPVVARLHRGGVERVLELYDLDELRWAVLSRGLCTGEPEQARLREGALRLTCPLPIEALRPRALCAVESWTWTPPPFVDLPAFAELVARRFGLSLD